MKYKLFCTNVEWLEEGGVWELEISIRGRKALG